MDNEIHKDVIARIEHILETEKSALIEGKLDQIGPLTEQKQALFERLTSLDHPESSALEGIQAKAERNQELLNGALRGIRKVAKRLATLRAIRKSLETYDETGRKCTITGVAEHKVERRA